MLDEDMILVDVLVLAWLLLVLRLDAAELTELGRWMCIYTMPECTATILYRSFHLVLGSEW